MVMAVAIYYSLEAYAQSIKLNKLMRKFQDIMGSSEIVTSMAWSLRIPKIYLKLKIIMLCYGQTREFVRSSRIQCKILRNI